MDWDLLFLLTNIVAAAGWLALVVLPRTERVLAAVLYAGVGLLCAIYLLTFAGLVSGIADPVRDGEQAAAAFEYTVDGLMVMFAAKGAIVVGWTHYLAFDLFAGLWIARDADRRRVGRLTQLPFFAATFLAGPIGLLAWLMLREPIGRDPRTG